MSFKNKFGSKNDVDYKARLERKLYLARENPEPIFDISDCGLKNVPSGIYSLCKVFRKEALFLQCNKINSLLGGGALKDLSLLTVLDLHSNEFSTLPSDILHLTSLKELYLQDNKIKKLPPELMEVRNLSIFNISKNQLKSLPESMGQLRNLTSLDISFNKDLKILPKSLGNAHNIFQLNIDGLNLSYPPGDIISGGTIVIIAFLANECGISYLPDSSFKTDENDETFKKIWSSEQQKDNNIQATLMKLEKMKEVKQNTLLNVERNIKQQQEEELNLQYILKEQKKKLLEDLVDQQVCLEIEIKKVQKEKDLDRTRLLSYIYNASKEADNVINEFLKSNEETRQTQAALVEQEQKEKLYLLSTSHMEQSILRTKDTLNAMEKLLEEELLKGQKFIEYTEFRNCNAQSLLNLEVSKNDHLLQIMQNQERSRQDLINRLRQDEVLQKAVVAALLERSDARSWSINQQVLLVQSQLAALTNIELERKKHEINQQINDIADKRVTLSAILLNLLDQQKERREQLLETMKQIDYQRENIDSTKGDSLFWLLQYQSLIENRPQGLLEIFDPSLVRHVAIAGALHCLPFLSTLPSILHDLDDQQLISIGITNQNDREAIKLAVENYLAEMKLHSNNDTTPSAPDEESCASSIVLEEFLCIPSAPTECVVCMDNDCEVIFLPCGHFCCCSKCADRILRECPMCRANIDHKIRSQN